jgi:tRNA(Arg) A34 adenosine deaminase TadA
MREAIRLALEGLRAGKGGPFGAVVVLDGRIVGSGSNEVLFTKDPTAHAEVVATRAASTALGCIRPGRRGALLELRALPDVPRGGLLGPHREDPLRLQAG